MNDRTSSLLNTHLAADTRATLDARGLLDDSRRFNQFGLPKAPPDSDALSSSSSQPRSITSLRDRLLQEARNERQRCLQVAEAAVVGRRNDISISHVATQTDPVEFADDSAPGSRPSLGGRSGGILGGLGGAFGTGPLKGESGSSGNWSEQADEAAQAEALQTIRMLGERNRTSQLSDIAADDMEVKLAAERQKTQDINQLLQQERQCRVAAQQQILCLEQELDGKEAALQVAETTLEQKNAELTHAHLQLQLHGVSMKTSMTEDATNRSINNLYGSENGARRALMDTSATMQSAIPSRLAVTNWDDTSHSSTSNLTLPIEARDRPFTNLDNSMSASRRPSVGLQDDQIRLQSLTAQVQERERQLDLKDQHISNLLGVLRQHRGLLGEEESTAYGSEKSAPSLRW